MKRLSLIAVLVFLVGLAGCAGSGKYVPDHAFKEPNRGVSVKHPKEINSTKVTTFVGVMDPGLWPEIVAGGGVWPTVARTPDGELLKGYCFLNDLNYWGDFLLKFVYPHDRKELEKAEVLYFNRDAGWGYKISGQEFNYNPKKFDEDPEYQEKVFRNGTDLEGLNSFWSEYLRKKGATVDISQLSSVRVYDLKSASDLERFKKQLGKRFPNCYKMGNEEVRCGHLPLEQFKQIAVRMPGFNGGERFVKKATLPLAAVPFTGVGIAATAGASVVGSAVAAGVDDSWSGFYGRAETMRHQLAPNFRQISRAYKSLIRKKNETIKELRAN